MQTAQKYGWTVYSQRTLFYERLTTPECRTRTSRWVTMWFGRHRMQPAVPDRTRYRELAVWKCALTQDHSDRKTWAIEPNSWSQRGTMVIFYQLSKTVSALMNLTVKKKKFCEDLQAYKMLQNTFAWNYLLQCEKTGTELTTLTVCSR
jgi:hypothetical protein